jgi:hypothetical protein
VGDGVLGDRASRRQRLAERIRGLHQAIIAGDDARVEESVLQLSRSRRSLAPLALGVGAFAMLFQGLRLIISNWRLALIQLWPALWIWVAMLDIKLHLLYGKPIHSVLGPLRIPIVAGVALVTVTCFYLNAVFAFAVGRRGQPEIHSGFTEARAHRLVILGWGLLIGLAAGGSTAVFPRWGLWWFTFSLGGIIAVMMICYVAVPARLIGFKATHSKRDKLAAAGLAATFGALLSAPPYALSRVGILMLGWGWLVVPGVVVLTLGVSLDAGATGAVKTIKMSGRLMVGG